MFKLSITLLALLACATAQADQYNDIGQVVSVKPLYQEVNQQVCDQVQVAQPSSGPGLGTLIGGIAGGLLGNQVGGGTGRTIATAAGAVTGALVGGNMQSQPQTQTICRNVVHEQQNGFDVQYRYNGQVHEAHMNRDPGSTVNLSVQPY